MSWDEGGEWEDETPDDRDDALIDRCECGAVKEASEDCCGDCDNQRGEAA